MNMNMKNEKTMLALILVAALAMVSVAGVALASESDADTDVSNLTIVKGDLDIKASTSDSYGVYGDSIVTIAADADYTGTLCFGTYDEATKVFTPLVTLTLTGVSNVIFEYDAANNYVWAYVNETEDADGNIVGVVSGDIVISQGEIDLGYSSANYFTGTVKGNTATIEAYNVEYFYFTADTTDIVEAEIEQGLMETYDAETEKYVLADASLTISGTATIGSWGLDYDSDNVSIIIAEGATVTGGDNPVKYEVSNASGTTLTLTIPDMVGAIATISGSSIDSIPGTFNAAVTGPSIDSIPRTFNAAVTGSSASTVTFVLPEGFDISGSYDLQIAGYAVDGTDVVVYTYVGSLTFTVTTTTANNVTTTTVMPVLSSNVTANRLSISALTLGESTITFDKDTYTPVYGTAFTSAMVEKTMDSAAGVFTLDNGATFAIGDYVFVVLKNTSGAYYVYFGQISTAMSFGPNSGATAYQVITGTADPTVGQIKAGAILYSDIKETSQIVAIELDYATDKLIVNGTLNLGYVSLSSYAYISGPGEVTVSGHIYGEYDINAPIENDVVLNAAYYNTTLSTTTTPKNLRTYTTIATALTEADKIFVVGTHDILGDLELVSTLEGSTTTEITIMNGAKVNVGNDDEDALATAIVTVPSNSTVYINGEVDVLNGQFRVAGIQSDIYGTAVVAAVFYYTSEYGIYTDLATALGLATTAGETITLRDVAVLSTDATLAAGVILDSNSYMIIIKSGTTFTVNGIIKADVIAIMGAYGTGANAKTAGTLVLNCYDKDMTITTIVVGVPTTNGQDAVLTYGGIITFGSAFDVGTTGKITTDIGIVLSSEANPLIVNVNGNLTYNGDVATVIDGFATFNVAGTATFTKTMDVHDIVGTANVTGTLSAVGTSAAPITVAFSYINVTGSGIISTDNGYVGVAVKFVSGTPSKEITASNNGTKAVVCLGNGATAVIYGTYSASDIMVYNTSATSADLFTTVFYVNTSVVYKTQIGYTGTALDLTSPEFTAYNFLGWYDAAVNGTKVKSANINDIAEVFGYTQIKTTSITLSMAQNGVWTVNGISYGTSGNIDVPYSSSYVIEVLADNGYELSSDFQILVNGHAMPANYTPVEGDVISFSGSINEKAAPSEGMDLVTILLIIITIVIIIMAIIIALKLMRS